MDLCTLQMKISPNVYLDRSASKVLNIYIIYEFEILTRLIQPMVL